MTEIEKTYGAKEIEQVIESLAQSIAKRHTQAKRLVIVGIANGGVPFGEKLVAALKNHRTAETLFGSVNITYHRDDLSQKPIPEDKLRTNMPCDIENEIVILADDVLFSGRTARAALNEVFDQGRPALVELAVLVDRGNRRIPLQADYVGITHNTSLEQNVEVSLQQPSPEQSTIHVTGQ